MPKSYESSNLRAVEDHPCNTEGHPYAACVNEVVHSTPTKLEDAGCSLNYGTVERQIKNLTGEVLTVLDASYVNEAQNKAVKSLVKKAFRNTLNSLWNDMVHPDKGLETSESVTGYLIG